MASNRISLNKAERQAELAADKQRVAARKAERVARHAAPPVAYQLTLADVDKARLQRVSNEPKAKKKTAAPVDEDAAEAEEDADGLADTPSGNAVVDPIKTETLNILSDLVRQQTRPEIAHTAGPAQPNKE